MLLKIEYNCTSPVTPCALVEKMFLLHTVIKQCPKLLISDLNLTC